MTDLLAWLEQSPPAAAFRTSFYVYPLVNAAHIAAVGALLTLVVLMDLRLLGRLSALPLVPFTTAMRRAAIGAFVAAALTGAALFSVRATEYAANPAFLVKLGLIMLAGLNIALHGWTRSPVFLLASMLIWATALVAGRFIGFL